METARSEGKPFDFTHFVLISKLHEATRKDSEARKKKVKGDNQILWVNAEEEAISEVGLLSHILWETILIFFPCRSAGRNSRRIFSAKRIGFCCVRYVG